MPQDFLSSFSLTFTILGFFFSLAPYWLPVLLGYVFWQLWMSYVQLVHISEIEWVLLGIRLPKTIMKTPLSMELVLSSLHQTSEGTWYDRRWKGRVKSWFSLELVSLGGDTHFFIRTNKKFKNFIEAQLYSQYPGIEVFEAPDYTEQLEFKPGKSDWQMWGTEFVLTKPDPYPIKTYIDYKLDQAIKKEEDLATVTDPIAPTVEFLGSIGKNEQIWIQILVRATGKRFDDPKSWFGIGKRDWKSEAKDMIAKMQKKGEDEKLSKSESEIISAIEREVSKFGFDCGMRAIYLGKGEAFNPLNIAGVVGTMKHYNSEVLNGFRPNNTTDVDFPWQDLSGKKVPHMKTEMFKAYRDRGYFHSPYKKKPFILNTEELATIYHFPSGLETPGFTTISSRKAEPPVNLPI
jgi:hypothetical protein